LPSPWLDPNEPGTRFKPVDEVQPTAKPDFPPIPPGQREKILQFLQGWRMLPQKMQDFSLHSLKYQSPRIF
jgi:hypothetical protein